jgi:protein-tyrosine phosphatase
VADGGGTLRLGARVREDTSVIDLHSHILPGLDDGVDSLTAAVELARTALADGVEVIAATPHVRDDYPTAPAQMEHALAETRAALDGEQLPLQLLPGGEIALDRLPQLAEDELRRFTLGGTSQALLLEFPYYGWPLSLEEIVFDLRVRGFRPVLAHPERNPDVQAAPHRLEQAIGSGALVQLTAASLDGRLGRRTSATAFCLLELGYAHLIASDAHAPSVRQMGMSAAAAAVGAPELARWLTLEVPRAILDDEPLAERPLTPRAPRRPWRRRY